MSPAAVQAATVNGTERQPAVPVCGNDWLVLPILRAVPHHYRERPPIHRVLRYRYDVFGAYLVDEGFGLLSDCFAIGPQAAEVEVEGRANKRPMPHHHLEHH